MQTTIPKKGLGVVVALVLTAACISAFTIGGQQQQKRNLKVLPQDISRDSLGMIMDHFKMALGVKCGFCHAQSTTNPGHLDFASDAKPEKTIARHMYKMAMKINKKFFSQNKDDKGELIVTVTCMTCHHGSPHPGEAK